MKSAVADYRYRVLCLRIVPTAGSPIYLPDHPRDLVMSGHTYLSTAGYEFTGYSGATDFAPASIDVEMVRVGADIAFTPLSASRPSALPLHVGQPRAPPVLV